MEATTQSEGPTLVDASVHWKALEVPVEEKLLRTAADAMDISIGFEDKKLLRPELKAGAQYLMAHGCEDWKIKSLSDAHRGKIEQLRSGDTLVCCCGTIWYKEGGNGRSYLTHGTKLKVMSVGLHGFVQGQSTEKHEHGRIPVARDIFDIEDTWEPGSA